MPSITKRSHSTFWDTQQVGLKEDPNNTKSTNLQYNSTFINT